MTVAITGWAWRTPLGDAVDGVVGRLLAGERAGQPEERFATYPCSFVAPMIAGAELDVATARKGSVRFARRLERLGIQVAKEALAMSGLGAGPRLGLYSAIAGLEVSWDELMPALERQEPSGARSWERGLKSLHPFWMLQHLSNTSHALASAELGATGDGATFGGETAGGQALSAAIRALEVHAVDRALVFAHDSLLAAESLMDVAVQGRAARGSKRPAAPYDEHAVGFVPGEAVAALVLERESDIRLQALARIGARTGADGERGEPRAETIAHVAGQAAKQTEVVDGAARGRLEDDLAERQRLAGIVGEGCPLIAIQAAMGHLGAATALVQSIALGALLQRQALPRIAGLERPARGPLRPLLETRPASERVALGVSTGAPGLVAVVCVEAPQ